MTKTKTTTTTTNTSSPATTAVATPNVNSKTSLQKLQRPSSARSFTSAISTGTANTSHAYVALKMERDLMERMVQERDEKMSSLQKTIDMQQEYISGVQEKMDRQQERQKQEEIRQKLYLKSLTHEKKLIKSQLSVLQKENQRIKDDPIHLALISRSNSNNDDDDDSLTSLDKETKPKSPSPQIKILDGDQRCLVLQSQLYRAMNSVSTLQHQTVALKESYDEIVNSLQRELIDSEESTTKMEVKLLSRMTVLEREKKIVEELLENKISIRDVRIRRLEKRIRNLDRIDDDESLAQVEVDETEKDSIGVETGSILPENNDYNNSSDDASNASDGAIHEDSQNGDSSKDRHHEVDNLLTELEMLSAHSSSRKLFSNAVE